MRGTQDDDQEEENHHHVPDEGYSSTAPDGDGPKR
jgi:hypothetical protein